MTSLLDVTRLPVNYVLADGTDVADIISAIRPAMEKLMEYSQLRTTDSFGFAMIDPNMSGPLGELDCWDDPYAYICFVGGWGPNRDRCIADAVRKLRAHARTGVDTLTLRLWDARGDHDKFKDVVESVDAEGYFPWGDYPWGGSSDLWLGDQQYHGSVSCFEETENPAPATLILALIAGHNASPELVD